MKRPKPHTVVRGLVSELERIQMQQKRISAETRAFADTCPTCKAWFGTVIVVIGPFANASLIQSEHSRARTALIRDNLNRAVDLEKGWVQVSA